MKSLTDSVQVLAGVGPKRAQALQELGIQTKKLKKCFSWMKRFLKSRFGVLPSIKPKVSWFRLTKN
ncbi:hypothetical protein OGM84_01795 [Pediococcus acidilactici]